MSNNVYLLSANDPSLVAPTADNILLQAAYHLPLVWLLGISEDEILTEERRDNEGRIYQACGASIPREKFIKRLCDRQHSAKVAFASRGDVTYHMNLFAGWLAEQTCEFVCIDWTEYNFLNGDDHLYVVAAIAEAASPQDTGVGKMLEVSTVVDGARFITLDQAYAGDFTEQEQHTFFRLLGDSYSVSVPWR